MGAGMLSKMVQEEIDKAIEPLEPKSPGGDFS
jgi:hypothetical protein